MRLLICLLILTVGAAHGQKSTAEIKPPFGLQWLTTTERMQSLLRASKAVITEKRMIGSREAWTVEGLTQPGLRRTVFYFTDGALVEIELQYEHATWDAAKYNEFLVQVKKRIEQKYGPGRVVNQSTETRGDVKQTVLGYEWEQEMVSLQLFYFSAERPPLSFRNVSLHYRAR